MQSTTDILRQYWGYDSFRPLQEQIINSVLAGRDTLALMPTGGGKSLCYQVPAMATEGLCLVVTPLIALMKDQVEHLRRLEIKADAIYTGITQREIDIILDNCQFGNYKFLYVSPERLQSSTFRKRLAVLPINLIAVDEAHCISQWGYDFRPAYLCIADIREIVGLSPSGSRVPILALTATATPEVVDDIQDKLHFAEKNVLKTSFARDNLTYVVRQTDDKEQMMLNILNSVAGSSIVYVRNRQSTRQIAEYLTVHGIMATYYHAGLSNQEKDLRQAEWKSGRVRVMVATNAFGMGIDKPDVRTVIHRDLPDSIEAYFQEAGRAGRDGQTAYAVLLYNKSDNQKAKKRITDNYPPREFIKRVYEAIGDWLEVALGYGLERTFVFPFDKFCQEKHLPLLPTFSAIQILQQAGFLSYIDETETQPKVQLLLTKEQLYAERLTAIQEKSVAAILRTYTGVFADPVYINEDRLCKELNIEQKTLSETLISLAQSQMIRYVPRRKTPYITFVQERQPLEYVQIPESVYEQQQGRYIERLKAMVEYAEQKQFCRQQLMLFYFGEKDAPICQHCDVCRKNLRK